jgi:hypothetical protein
MGRSAMKTVRKNPGLAALALLGGAGGAYALSNRNKKSYDIEDLLEAYYAGMNDIYSLDEF